MQRTRFKSSLYKVDSSVLRLSAPAQVCSGLPYIIEVEGRRRRCSAEGRRRMPLGVRSGEAPWSATPAVSGLRCGARKGWHTVGRGCDAGIERRGGACLQRVLGLGGGGVARRVGVLGAHRLAAKAAARPVAMLMPAALRHAGCSELTHALAGTAPSRAKREVTEAPRPRTWHARAGLRARPWRGATRRWAAGRRGAARRGLTCVG